MLLLVELFDELVFGAWNAAWPLVRTDLGLTYVEVGVLLSVPSLVGNILEPPLGLLGDAWNRRALVRGGGVCFATGLVLLAAGHSFPPALLALALLSPASGAFVGLSQASLMDLEPARHEANMARWVLAGSLGIVCGPLLVTAATALGLGWRATMLTLAGVCVLLLLAVWRAPLGGNRPGSGNPAPCERGRIPGSGGRVEGGQERPPLGAALREGAAGAVEALRDRFVVRWLVLLQLADLALDVLHGFLALYLVDAAGATPAQAALGIVGWTAVGLIGDAAMVPLLTRVDGTRWVRLSAAAFLAVFPLFLTADGLPTKLVLLGVLGVLNSGWYAVLQGRLYSALPGRSATVMALTSTAGIAGALLPLLVAVAAERWGLGTAMWLLAAGPCALVLGTPRRAKPVLPGLVGPVQR